MSHFIIDYNGITYELNMEIINDHLFNIVNQRYLDALSILSPREIENIKKPIKYNIPCKYIHIEYVDFLLNDLQNFYDIDKYIIYDNFYKELENYEKELENVLHHISIIRYDTVIIYSKFVTDELIDFLYDCILNVGLDNKDDENKILFHSKIEYSITFNNIAFINWMIKKQNEYLLFYKCFDFIVKKINSPNKKQKYIIDKYNKINVEYRLHMSSILIIQKKFKSLHSKIDFLLAIVVNQLI